MQQYPQMSSRYPHAKADMRSIFFVEEHSFKQLPVKMWQLGENLSYPGFGFMRLRHCVRAAEGAISLRARFQLFWCSLIQMNKAPLRAPGFQSHVPTHRMHESPESLRVAN